MWANHPEIAKRWTREYGSKPRPKKHSRHKKHKKSKKHKKGKK